MNDFNFTQWISIVGPLATLYGAMFYIMREDMRQLATQHREELKEQRQLWSELLKSFCDFKNVTVERFSKLENEGKR